MDRQARTTEVMKIFTKLRDMGLGITEYDEMIRFRHLCNAFIRSGEPMRGKLPIPGTQRVVWYHFDSNRVDCMLKYDETV